MENLLAKVRMFFKSLWNLMVGDDSGCGSWKVQVHGGKLE